MKFTEAQLESAIIELLGAEGYPQVFDEAFVQQLVSPAYKFTANSELAEIANSK